MQKRILLLYGGTGNEHDVSVMGYEYVSSLLQNTGYDILPTYVSRAGEWYIGGEGGVRAHLCAKDGSLYTEYGFIKIDAAIPLLHGDGGEDGRIQGALDTAGIPYVGADATASAVCIDKYYTKAIAESLGIPTVPSVLFSKRADTRDAYGICLERLGLPMFVKPTRLGSSVGAYPVYDKNDFFTFFPLAMEKGSDKVIAEKLVKGKRELECAYYSAGGCTLITAPGEILIDGFYGYREKYGGTTRILPIADIDRTVADTVKDYSRMLVEALGLRHLGRIDFFLTEEGIYFNEVNTFPGFTKDSLYPKMLEASGIAPRDALVSFIRELC